MVQRQQKSKFKQKRQARALYPRELKRALKVCAVTQEPDRNRLILLLSHVLLKQFDILNSLKQTTGIKKMIDYTMKKWLVTLIFKNGDIEYSEQPGANDYSSIQRALNEINPYGQRVIDKTYAGVIK